MYRPVTVTVIAIVIRIVRVRVRIRGGKAGEVEVGAEGVAVHLRRGRRGGIVATRDLLHRRLSGGIVPRLDETVRQDDVVTHLHPLQGVVGTRLPLVDGNHLHREGGLHLRPHVAHDEVRQSRHRLENGMSHHPEDLGTSPRLGEQVLHLGGPAGMMIRRLGGGDW
jgi:hypothetical protein